MAIRFETILYVENQERSRDFYRAVLGIDPSLDVPGMTEFQIGDAKLGLMPNAGIKKLLGEVIPDPVQGAGIPRCELYLTVNDPMPYLERAISAGATLLSPFQSRDWGDEAVYLSDPDSHVIAIARTVDHLLDAAH